MESGENGFSVLIFASFKSDLSYFRFILLDFATISRLMGVKWHQLSDKEKAYYQNLQRKQTVKHKNIPSLSAKKLSSRRGSGHSGKQMHCVEEVGERFGGEV